MAGYRLYSAGNRFAHLLLALMLLCVVLPRLAQAKALPAAPAMTVAGQEPTEDMRASGTASLPPVQVTRDTASDTDPSLTQTDDGKLWVVWSSSRSGNQDIWYSTSIDSRATWSAAIQLTTHASDDRSPAITQGADGKLWVTWHSSRSGNNDIWYKTSNDAGNTWSVDRQFTTSPASDESPDVFRASDGRLCMVWQSSLGNSDIWYTASVDNGATWSAASQLTTDPGSDVSPTVTQTADGWLWVVWTRWLGRGDLWYRTSSDNGSTWSTESMLSSTAYGEFGGPSIAQAGDGTVWLMWSSYNFPKDSALWYMTSADNGATWSASNCWSAVVGYEYSPDIARLNDGSVAVVWSSDRTTNYDVWFGIFGLRDDADPRPKLLWPVHGSAVAEGNVFFDWSGVTGATGYEIQIDHVATFDSPDLLTATEGKHQHTATLSLGTWYWRVRALPDGPWTRAWRVLVADPLVRVTTDSDGDFDPSIIQASDGTLWAVWWAWRGFGPDLWYSTSSDGGATWASHTQLTASPGFDTHAAIAQAADGRVWVVWTSDRTGTPQLWHKTSNDGGLSWSPDSQFTTDAGRNYSSAMARTADGRLWVVWISDRAGNGDVWYKTSSDNGATWSPELQLTTEAGWDDAPAITQDADGNVWVVWSSGRAGNQDIWFKTTSDSGSTWSAESQLTTSTDHEYYPTLDRANDGTLWLMWNRYIYSDYSGSQLWYKTSSDNGATWSKEKQWTRFMGQDYLADLAALQDGSVAVAWCSDRAVNWEIWFGVFGQREDVNPPPHVQKTHHRPGPNPDSDDTVTIRAFVADEAAVVSVHALWTCDGTPQADLALYDDGAHNDDSAGDGWYGGQIGPFPVGTQVSYQVRAVDSDGNSFTAPEPRWAPSFTVLELFAKKSDILFVADDGSYSGTAWFRDYYTQAFDDGGWAYDLWSVHWRGAPDATVLNQYADGAVVWASPAWNGCVRVGDIYCSRSSTLDALRSYLDNGGRLFLSSQDLGVSLQWETFLPEYLYAEFVNENSGLHQLKGTAGDPIGDGLALGITGGDGANNQNSPDEINPIPPAVAVLSYDQGALAPVRELESALPSASGLPTGQPQWGNETNPLIRFAASVPSFLGGAGHPLTPCADCALRQQAQRASTDTAGVMPPGTAAVRVDTGTYKVVYFAFGFEGINARTDRAVVMDRVLRWLGVPPPARLEFSPSAQTVRACSGRLTMDVELQESPALGGFELVVTYDPQIVHVEGFSLGSFLHSTTRVFTPLPAQIDNSAGTAALGAFSFGAEPAPSGSGPIATITFTVVNTGTAALSMEQVQLTRPDAKLIRTVTKGGSITVLPALFADVDCDCDVDVVDIMLVASRWRARLGDANYDPRYDLDGDDDIDIVDIMLVASHWSETCGDSTGTSRASRQTTAARPDAARARATDVQITARQAESKPGDVFTVDVAVNNARDLGGFECTLTFDPQALQVEKVELGSFLASTGRSVAALGPEMDNKKGSVHLGAFTYGQKFGPDGRGILARVTVRSLQAGGGRLAISHLQLVDTAGHLAPMGPLRDE